MKKILLLVLILGCSFYGFSQSTKYGVRGGLNISNLNFDGNPMADNTHRNGFVIGFFGEYGLSNTVYIMPELQFSAEGAKPEPMQLDYIQMPVLFKFRLSEKLYFGAGPQVGLKINKVDDGVRNFAYSGVTGFEFKLSHMLFADARYTYGFSNIFDENLGIKATNSTIQFGVGYKF
ncbi:porin family protein [Yeosuana marina]|uniref:porin family protein n=1 Tax=Yeosuana marina TaxID=1565536 RepID=UPI00141F369E|nr:porin family protein [Yeosuana marina]